MKREITLFDRRWNKFILGNIVESVQNRKSHNASDLVPTADGTDYVSYVTKTGNNNDISMYVQSERYDGLEKANTITIGNTTTTIFLQGHDFIAGPHIIVIHADWLNIYTANFIVTLLNQEKRRYPIFDKAFTKDLIATTKLNLLVDDKGNPDYQFMEDYIKSLPFSTEI